MKFSKKVLKYAKENFNEVKHTTLNPEGPGVVRIHLIPPKVTDEEIGAGENTGIIRSYDTERIIGLLGDKSSSQEFES